MSDKTIKLFTTGRAMLTLAATRADRLVPPPKLPVAAARQVVRSLINNGLLEEIATTGDDSALVWRTSEDGVGMVLRATGAGLDAVSESAGTSGQTAPDDWSDRIEPASQAHIALVKQLETDKQLRQRPLDDGRVQATKPIRRLG